MNPEIAKSIESKLTLKLVSVCLVLACGRLGAIVIKPQFDCALPFENGVAEVSTNCKTETEGEHSTWVSDHWEYIVKTGKKTSAPKPAND